MSPLVTKLLRVTCTHSRRRIVGTVTHGLTKVIIKNPIGRRVGPRIATLNVFAKTLRCTLKPAVKNFYLRGVRLQENGTFEVREGMTFSYRGYRWQINFVNMQHVTRSHSRQFRPPGPRATGQNLLKKPTIPGIPYMRMYPSDGEVFDADDVLWLPGRITDDTDVPQRHLFFQPYQSPSILNATWAASHLYSPRRDFLSAISSLPQQVNALDLRICSSQHAYNLEHSVVQLSTMAGITSLALQYDLDFEATIGDLVPVPVYRRPAGHLIHITCNSVTDECAFNAIKSLLQYNPHVKSLNLGRITEHVAELIQFCRNRRDLKGLSLVLDDTFNYVPLLQPIRSPQFQLYVLHLSVRQLMDPEEITELLESQSSTLEVLSITETNPRDDHICSHNCQLNIIPHDMPALDEVILTTLTCVSSTLAGIVNLEQHVKLNVNVSPGDHSHLYNFAEDLEEPRSSPITTIVVNEGRVLLDMLSPLVLQYNPILWGNITTLDVSHIRLSDIPTCLTMGGFLENVRLATLPPTADDLDRRAPYIDPQEKSLADFFLVGSLEGRSLTDCVFIQTLELVIAMPDPAVLNVPAVGASLFQQALSRYYFLRSFKCNNISANLMILLDLYEPYHNDFISVTTLHHQ